MASILHDLIETANFYFFFNQLHRALNKKDVYWYSQTRLNNFKQMNHIYELKVCSDIIIESQ